MAKKLMMNNYSENGLMPVMDGLVCWLDGRDYDISTNTIKCRVSDIIAKANFPLSDSKCTLAKKSIKCENIYFTISNVNEYITQGAVELTCDIQIPHSRSNLLFDGSGNYMSCGIWYGDNSSYTKTPYKFSYHDYAVADNTTDAYSIDIPAPTGFKVITGVSDATHNYMYSGNILNGSAIRHQSNGSLKFNNSCTFVGRKSGYYPSLIYFGSLKIYNRALTDEEIAQNYLYEQSIKRGE